MRFYVGEDLVEMMLSCYCPGEDRVDMLLLDDVRTPMIESSSSKLPCYLSFNLLIVAKLVISIFLGLLALECPSCSWLYPG